MTVGPQPAERNLASGWIDCQRTRGKQGCGGHQHESESVHNDSFRYRLIEPSQFPLEISGSGIPAAVSSLLQRRRDARGRRILPVANENLMTGCCFTVNQNGKDYRKPDRCGGWLRVHASRCQAGTDHRRWFLLKYKTNGLRLPTTPDRVCSIDRVRHELRTGHPRHLQNADGFQLSSAIRQRTHLHQQCSRNPG